jgi:hypothetical protein
VIKGQTYGLSLLGDQGGRDKALLSKVHKRSLHVYQLIIVQRVSQHGIEYLMDWSAYSKMPSETIIG